MNARPLWHFLVLLLLTSHALACSKKPEQTLEPDAGAFQAANNTSPAAPEQPPSPPPPRPSPDAIAWGEGIVVTTDEFARAARQGVFFTTDEGLLSDGGIPDTALSRSYLQLSVTRGLISMKLLDQEAQRRGLIPKPEEIEAFLSNHHALKRFASEPFKTSNGAEIPYSWDRYNVTREDLVQIGRTMLIQEKLRAALLDELGKQDHWESYRHAHTRRRLIILHSANVPTSAEIDDLLTRDAAQKSSAIDEYFQNNKRRYMTPRTVRLTTLNAPYGADITQWRDTLAKAAERLKAGDDPAKIAKELKLTLKTDVTIVRQENSIAFSAKIGETGHTEYGPLGLYAWRVESIQESQLPELDRPLRREIAATLLQFQLTQNAKLLHDELRDRLSKLTPTPAGDIAQADLDALRAAYSDKGVQIVVTEPFPLAPDGFIPGVGLVEPLAKAAFEQLTLDKPTLPRPIVSRQRVYSARLLDVEQADRAAYEAERAAWTKKIQEQRSPTILEVLINDLRQQRQITVDLEPLRKRFGEDDKKGQPVPDEAKPLDPATDSAAQHK
jgi:hypothetical protein